MDNQSFKGKRNRVDTMNLHSYTNILLAEKAFSDKNKNPCTIDTGACFQKNQ